MGGNWNYGIVTWPGTTLTIVQFNCVAGQLLLDVVLAGPPGNDVFTGIAPTSGSCGSLVYTIPSGHHSTGGTLTVTW
jgi:hypothetical protein